MTAIGFVIVALVLLRFWGGNQFFWQEHQRYLQILEALLTVGLLLMVAGIGIFLWRFLP